MEDDEKATDTHDIGNGGNGGSGGDTKDKPQIICEPIPIPPDRHGWLISEGCLAVALLSMATTVITLTMLKAK